MSTFRKDIFKDKVVVVTGATTNDGIGMGIVESFARLGAKVYALGLNSDQTEPKAELNIEVMELDVTDFEAIDQFVEGLDQLDIFVHGAGVALENQYEYSIYSKTMDINVNAGFYFVNRVRDLLSESDNGNVIFISSMYAIFGSDANVAYSASKGAIDQMVKSLAIEYAKDGIRVNAIAPGFINTVLMDRIPREVQESITNSTPLHRLGETEETGEVVAFLCSPGASFVTGQILPVCGGYSIWKD